MFFTDGLQKKWNCQGKLLHTHPLLFLYLWDKKKIVTNSKKLLNSYIWQSECLNYKITAFVFFYFQVGWGWFVGDSTWLIHYKKQTATQLYCQIPSKFVLQLYSFDSVYSFVVFGKDIIVGGGEKGSDNTFFSKITSHYFTTINIITPWYINFWIVFSLFPEIWFFLILWAIILLEYRLFMHVIIWHFTC
jgi:hypothetical protein